MKCDGVAVASRPAWHYFIGIVPRKYFYGSVKSGQYLYDNNEISDWRDRTAWPRIYEAGGIKFVLTCGDCSQHRGENDESIVNISACW